jgi:hypothetical protein
MCPGPAMINGLFMMKILVFIPSMAEQLLADFVIFSFCTE